MGELSRPQLRMLRAVASAWERKGYAPTVREMAKACGYTSTNSAHEIANRLRARGLLTWVDGQPRTIRLTDGGREVAR